MTTRRSTTSTTSTTSPRRLTAVARLLAFVLVLLAWSRPAPAAPRLEPAAHAGRISVLAEPGLEAVAQELAGGAERELDRIAEDLLDLPSPRAIEVRLVREAKDLAAVAPAGRGAPPWAIGVAYPDLGVISVAMRRGAALADPQTTLRHELAHIALGAALGDRAPHWLHEGFAYQHSGEWSWERTETLAGMALTQLVRPGAPVIMGSFVGAISMRTGAPTFGTAEATQMIFATAQLARRLGDSSARTRRR